MRLAAITGGGTVIMNAASNAAAAPRACIAVCSVLTAIALSQVMYGTTAANIRCDAAPIHGPLVSSLITEL
ncbi:hypothetical protein MSTO_08050 [Mycobacterium stomatepiae]|uniref:Uncharacterized protein n=1 Tax=Mycobacterium stomatepiae TaxID=470076 RepID=A0A7I7Q2G6_9MYCO|nr:hypothetical protein MSTO_08050 [Mycobacterium stomatepiae]